MNASEERKGDGRLSLVDPVRGVLDPAPDGDPAQAGRPDLNVQLLRSRVPGSEETYPGTGGAAAGRKAVTARRTQFRR